MVILSEDHRLPQVAVDVWYHVGVSDEPPGESNVAQLFEHMMFTGSKQIDFPRQVLEAVGSSTDMANGMTGFDRTKYSEVVPAAELPAELWLESDRMGSLLRTLNPKRLEVQRDFVANETRQEENRPYATPVSREREPLFPHHAYGVPNGELIKDAESATLEEARAFFEKLCVPNNASLVIAGDFDRKQANGLAASYFGPIPRGAPVAHQTLPEPVLSAPVRESIKGRVATVPQARVAWSGVKQLSADQPAGDVLARMFTVGGRAPTRSQRSPSV